MRRFASSVVACLVVAACGSFGEEPPPPKDGGANEGGTVDGGDAASCVPSGPTQPFCSDNELLTSDETAPSSPRTVTASSKDEETPFTPRCMTIRAGQSVTFSAKFSSHPLIQRAGGSLPNPIPTVESGSAVTVTFPCPGDFNYSCRTHEDNMNGTIRVIP